MKKTNITNKTTPTKGIDGIKLQYKTPVLAKLGDIRVLTQSSGSANGDGGQNMML